MCELAHSFNLKAKSTKITENELIKLLSKTTNFKIKKWSLCYCIELLIQKKMINQFYF